MLDKAGLVKGKHGVETVAKPPGLVVDRPWPMSAQAGRRRPVALLLRSHTNDGRAPQANRPQNTLREQTLPRLST